MKQIIHFSAYYKLTAHLFKSSLKRNLLLSAALFILTWILLLSVVSGENSLFAYETLTDISNLPYVFMGSIALSAILTAFQIYLDVHRNHGSHILLTLPLPRRTVFFAYCTVGILGILMIWSAGILALFSAYVPVTNKCETAAAAYAKWKEFMLPFEVHRTNGLFLAAIRNGLFRLLLPLSLPEALNSVLIILTAGCLPAYGLLGGPKRVGPVLMLFALAEVIYAMNCRYEIFTGYNNAARPFTTTVIMALLFVYLIISGIVRLNRSANIA